MKSHILIVDDEAPIREILGQMLAQSGFRVSEAATASEAQQLAERDAPDLVISDLQLEESDGLAMISRLKGARPALPVILLTGVLFDDDVVRTTLSQVVSVYLPKTTPLAKVLAEVRRLLPASGA
jgi:DNA-binding response OmpR family regulator